MEVDFQAAVDGDWEGCVKLEVTGPGQHTMGWFLVGLFYDTLSWFITIVNPWVTLSTLLWSAKLRLTHGRALLTGQKVRRQSQHRM